MKRSYQRRRGQAETPASRDSQPPSDPSRVITMLRGMIEQGDFHPGTRLPPERSLAEQLQVGRPAVREGIKALCILDVLESRRGDGTYVKSLSALSAGWPAKVEMFEGEFAALDLLEVRKMLEPAAARLAATRAEESHLRQIERECAIIEDETEDWTKIARHDFLLHVAIIDAVGNPILTKLTKALAPLLRRSREITASSAPDRSRMVSDHRAIVDAILRGEADHAEHAMLEHLHHVGLDLISSRKR